MTDEVSVGDNDDFERARILYINQRYEQALAMYLSLAEVNDSNPEIFSFIGWMYYKGLGTKQDAAEAFRWYQRAADLDYPPALLTLYGAHFRQGRLAQAKEALERAAVHDYGPALYLLGSLYEHGRGVPLDKDKAYNYFARAAEKGHLFARRQIAVRMVTGGYGVARIPKGIASLIATIFTAAWTYWLDPGSAHLRT